MSRHLRNQLKHLRERLQPPERSATSERRAQMVEHLNRIAEARRTGNWSDQDAAEFREGMRAEAARRRGGGVIPIG